MESTVDTKYYTPSLEEFHIGFEYEYKDNLGWHPIILNSYIVLKDWIADNPFSSPLTDFRVKYLDKEDIESLGFEKYEDAPNLYCMTDERVIERGGEFFIKAQNGSDIHLASDNWELFVYDDYILIYDLQINLVYKGICKNKSKLKSILKDVGVL